MRILVLAPLVALAACVRPAASPPPPAPVPVPAPTPALAPAPLSSDWRDWPIAPGTWSYTRDARGGLALFGQAGQGALVALRCDRAAGRVYLSRGGAPEAGQTMTVRTTSLTRAVAVRPTGATPAYLAAELATRDPLLDAMAFSRGRFTVEVGTLPKLAIPAWAEVARVIEDCR